MARISVKITNNFYNINVSPARLRRLINTIFNRFGSAQLPDTSYEISIAIVDNDQIRKLNRKFLSKNTATDCLSFDLSDSPDQKTFELVVNAERAVSQAGLRGHSAEAELALYITHSFLHNVGFDDSTRQKAAKMHIVEDEILQQLGYGSVYNSKIK